MDAAEERLPELHFQRLDPRLIANCVRQSSLAARVKLGWRAAT
jgi:hypothetical protein